MKIYLTSPTLEAADVEAIEHEQDLEVMLDQGEDLWVLDHEDPKGSRFIASITPTPYGLRLYVGGYELSPDGNGGFFFKLTKRRD